MSKLFVLLRHTPGSVTPSAADIFSSRAAARDFAVLVAKNTGFAPIVWNGTAGHTSRGTEQMVIWIVERRVR